MKWRKILSNWKEQNRRQTTLPKDAMAPQLKQLCEEIGFHKNASLISGFKATGIFPLDRQHVLKRLPDSAERQSAAKDALLHHLRAIRCPEKAPVAGTRRKRLNVQPGKSVAIEDIPGTSEKPVVSKIRLVDEMN